MFMVSTMSKDICLEVKDEHFGDQCSSFGTPGLGWQFQFARIGRTSLMQDWYINAWPALAKARGPDVNSIGRLSVVS